MAITTSGPPFLAARRLPAPPPRRARWSWLAALRELLAGAFLLAVWLALWTVTWAAVEGPLSPAHGASGARGAAWSRGAQGEGA
jgi:hypothetical protein